MSGVPIQKQNIGIEERKKTIQYCIDDIKEKENLAIISHTRTPSIRWRMT